VQITEWATDQLASWEHKNIGELIVPLRIVLAEKEKVNQDVCKCFGDTRTRIKLKQQGAAGRGRCTYSDEDAVDKHKLVEPNTMMQKTKQTRKMGSLMQRSPWAC
jgi:hypothetical protein